MADATASMNGTSGGRRNLRPPIDVYKPSMWGHVFSAFSFDDKVQEMHAECIEASKKEAKIMLLAAEADKLLKLIDTVERLGLAYHFETEIGEKIAEIYNVAAEDSDLFTTALRFRLLRQHRHHVSSSVFEKFTENNNFKESPFRKKQHDPAQGHTSSSIHGSLPFPPAADHIPTRSYASLLQKQVPSKSADTTALNFTEAPSCKKGDYHCVLMNENLLKSKLDVLANTFIGRVSYAPKDKPRSPAELMDCLKKFWSLRGDIKVIPLGKGYYNIAFSDDFDRLKASARPSWTISPGTLRLSPWSKGFNPYKVNTSVASVWMRIYELPMEFWDPSVILGIARAVGSPISIDKRSLNNSVGHFVRVLVEIDLSKPIEMQIMVESNGYCAYPSVDFENLPVYCPSCKIVGHSIMKCRNLQKQQPGASKPSSPSKRGRSQSCRPRNRKEYRPKSVVNGQPPVSATADQQQHNGIDISEQDTTMHENDQDPTMEHSETDPSNIRNALVIRTSEPLPVSHTSNRLQVLENMEEGEFTEGTESHDSMLSKNRPDGGPCHEAPTPTDNTSNRFKALENLEEDELQGSLPCMVQPLASAPPTTASSSPRFRTFPREPIQTRSTTRRLQQMEHDLSSVAVSKFRIISDGSSNAAMQTMQLVAHKKWKSLSSDVEGLLSLYEAANVQIHGEDILENAVVFATHHLTRLVQHLEESPLQDKLKQALQCPLHKSVTIIRVRNYISIYEKDHSKDELLLKFAKLNFNFLQNLYKKDLCELSRWWNKFDLKTTLPYVKDRLIESYIWGVAFHYEPQYSYVRKAVAISIQIITVTDDTYDNYATLNEAQLFSDTLERWNVDEIGPLPDYMKIVYHFLMSVFKDYEDEAAKEEKLFAIPYFKEAVIALCKAYNEEQIWVREWQIPSFQEYSANALVTSCVYIILMTLIPGMKSITKESLDWVMSDPKAVTTTAKMGRCLDDLSTHQRENKGGELLTTADFFMKYYDISKQETLAMWIKLCREGWKDLNAEWNASASAPKDIVELLINYARVCQLTYGSGDGYTNPEKLLAPSIAALFLDPIVI